MLDWDLASPQCNPNSIPKEIDTINIYKLSLDPDYPQEEAPQIANSLIPPPTTEEVEKTTAQEKTDIGTDNNEQGQLIDEESDTSLDFSGMSY